MSTIDKITAAEELFTELTPEQGAMVEGGATVTGEISVFIDKIQSIKAGADLIGKDDTYMTINGNKIWGDKSFSTGQTRGVNLGTSTPGAFARVELLIKMAFGIVTIAWEVLPHITPMVINEEREYVEVVLSTIFTTALLPKVKITA
ncbi:hypothetical protein [Moorena producens]|uniref:hypothetical protein n=1 Tax=Moorena producens TaxID=1155739 RepID=UPI003C767121